MISFLLCLALLIIGYFVYGKIVDAHSRRFAVVRSERVVNDLAIDKVADDQERQTE